MEEKINCLIHNRFDIVKRDVITGEIKEKAEAYNLITNAGWNAIFNGQGTYWYCVSFGNGTAEPQVTDTTLTSRLGYKNGTNVVMDKSQINTTGIIKKTFQIRLEANEYVGSTISEVGTGTDDTSTVFTKALLKDQNGNPLSIVKTNLDIIDIYATLLQTNLQQEGLGRLG